MPDDNLGVEFIEEKTSVDDRISRKQTENKNTEGLTGFVKKKTGIHQKKVNYILLGLAVVFFVASIVFIFIGFDKRQDITDRVFSEEERRVEDF